MSFFTIRVNYQSRIFACANSEMIRIRSYIFAASLSLQINFWIFFSWEIRMVNDLSNYSKQLKFATKCRGVWKSTFWHYKIYGKSPKILKGLKYTVAWKFHSSSPYWKFLQIFHCFYDKKFILKVLW